jgi:hypothetical protein
VQPGAPKLSKLPPPIVPRPESTMNRMTRVCAPPPRENIITTGWYPMLLAHRLALPHCRAGSEPAGNQGYAAGVWSFTVVRVVVKITRQARHKSACTIGCAENQAKAGIAAAPMVKRPPPPQTAGAKPAVPKQRRKRMTDEEVMARLRMWQWLVQRGRGDGSSWMARVAFSFGLPSPASPPGAIVDDANPKELYTDFEKIGQGCVGGTAVSMATMAPCRPNS